MSEDQCNKIYYLISGENKSELCVMRMELDGSGKEEMFEKDHQILHFCPYTIIFDMAPFAGADQIEELVIRDNRVQDLTGIGEMKSLRILDLEHNKFTDISPLKELIYLEALDIRDNQVENLDILLELPNLKVVFYEAQNKEQEEVLKKLIDKGCTVVETKDSFYSFLDKMGIETVELYSTDNI